ncbi:MAG: two-component sensor histidine kinase, partial [Zoogloea sp.]|nr:two-component sensor histidine kinase [Zoogloea sp.]
MRLRFMLPRSLFARIMLIWLAGIAFVLSVSMWLYLGERSHMTRQNVFEHITGGVTTAVRVLERLPSAERQGWLAQLGSKRMLFRLSTPPGGLDPLEADHPAWLILNEALPGRHIMLYRDQPIQADAGRRPPLWIGLMLADGQPLSVELIPPPPPQPPIQTLAALAALVLG